MHPSLSDPRCHQPLPEGPLAEHSRFYQRLHRRYANDLPLLPPGVPVLATMEQAYDALCARGCDTGTVGGCTCCSPVFIILPFCISTLTFIIPGQ